MIGKKIVLALSLCLAGSMIPLQASTCTSGATLASYETLGSTGCDINGLTFFNFAWVPTGGNPHATPADTGITVTDLINGNGTGFLLTFGTPTTFTAGGGGFSDGELSFTVKTVSGLSAINSIYQQIDGTVAGTGSYDDVLENYCLGLSSLGCTPLQALDAQINPGSPVCTSKDNPQSKLAGDGSGGCDDSVTIAAQSVIAVRKDIRADATAGATGASAAITGVVNQFGPAVPEPGTYLLSFIGLGLLFLGRHKFSRS